MSELRVKGHRSSKELATASFVTLTCQKLSGRGTWGHNDFLCMKNTLVKVKVTIEGYKGQILAQYLDLTSFQHLQFSDYIVSLKWEVPWIDEIYFFLNIAILI